MTDWVTYHINMKKFCIIVSSGDRSILGDCCLSTFNNFNKLLTMFISKIDSNHNLKKDIGFSMLIDSDQYDTNEIVEHFQNCSYNLYNFHKNAHNIINPNNYDNFYIQRFDVISAFFNIFKYSKHQLTSEGVDYLNYITKIEKFMRQLYLQFELIDWLGKSNNHHQFKKIIIVLCALGYQYKSTHLKTRMKTIVESYLNLNCLSEQDGQFQKILFSMDFSDEFKKEFEKCYIISKLSLK